MESTAQCHFLQDSMYMALYCVDGDVKPLRNLLIAQAVPNQIDDLPLAFSYLHIVRSHFASSHCALDDLGKE